MLLSCTSGLQGCWFDGTDIVQGHRLNFQWLLDRYMLTVDIGHDLRVVLYLLLGRLNVRVHYWLSGKIAANVLGILTGG